MSFQFKLYAFCSFRSIVLVLYPNLLTTQSLLLDFVAAFHFTAKSRLLFVTIWHNPHFWLLTYLLAFHIIGSLLSNYLQFQQLSYEYHRIHTTFSLVALTLYSNFQY